MFEKNNFLRRLERFRVVCEFAVLGVFFFFSKTRSNQNTLEKLDGSRHRDTLKLAKPIRPLRRVQKYPNKIQVLNNKANKREKRASEIRVRPCFPNITPILTTE